LRGFDAFVEFKEYFVYFGSFDLRVMGDIAIVERG
jgi:hypothetical protein